MQKQIERAIRQATDHAPDHAGVVVECPECKSEWLPEKVGSIYDVENLSRVALCQCCGSVLYWRYAWAEETFETWALARNGGAN